MLNKIVQKFSQFIAPPFCANCRQFIDAREPLCQECYDSIIPVVSTELEITPSKTMRVFALSDYENPLKKLILAKNHNNRVAPEYLAQLIIKTLPLKTMTFDYLVPVPLHWTRLIHRGFNQSEIMANALSKHVGKPVLNALYRSKRTPFQSTLNAEDRSENVKSAFNLMPDIPALNDKHVLLIDDLMTTGATLSSAAKLLLKCKPATITALVACRKL